MWASGATGRMKTPQRKWRRNGIGRNLAQSFDGFGAAEEAVRLVASRKITITFPGFWRAARRDRTVETPTGATRPSPAEAAGYEPAFAYRV